MTKVKGNSRDAITQRGLRDGEAKGKKRKRFNSNEKRRHRGPRLPNAFRRELQLQNPTVEEDIDSDDAVGNDVYEYEEGIAEEESMKNKRYDRVENFEYDLPENYEDWMVESDEDDDDDDPGRHDRMLEEITGLSADAFGGCRKRKDFIISEAYPETEFNPSNGDGQISMHDLLDPLQGKSGSNKLRKDLQRMKKKSIPTLAPLPKSDQQRVERKAAYEHFKKDITRWEPLVKRNREAPTLYFDEDVDLGFSTIGAIASEFKPRTDFEKKMASLVNQTEVVEAATLLETNEISVEERKARQEWNAKMRSFSSREVARSKRLKKIKSKTNHRRSRKDRIKAGSSIQMDPEAAKEHAMRLEFKRAEERMTLKHKNSSKWAKRILKRGLQNQDEATRAAFNELHDQHAALTRKVNSIRESSSSDDSSDDMSADSDEDATEKLIEKAKKKTLQVLEGDDELPTSGVLSLPFMVRAMQKKKVAVEEEARLALEEYEKLGDKSKLGSSDKDAHVLGGRRVFGVPKKLVNEARKKDKYSDGESDAEAMENDVSQHDQTGKITNEPDIDPSLLREEFGFSHDSVFKSFGNAAEPKTTYEVSYLGSDSWKKVRKQSSDTTFEGTEDNQPELITQTEAESEENDEEDSDTDSGGEMVDGILSSGPKSTYEVPSQVELIRRAFAGDDVEGEFAKEKDTVLDEENPEAEKPVLLPGWGQWTDIQKEKGLPCWMLKKHVAAKNERLESVKKRKDAGLNHVIISEKLDKKVEKLHTKRLPYPYTSKEVFEQSIRMPIGPEFNPVTAIGALNHPEVVKKAGVIIKPIQFIDDAIARDRGKPGKKVQRI